jgi:GH24 family phage-related lysozyme (muramidase)
MLSQEAIARLITSRLQNEEGYRCFAYDDKTGNDVKAPVGKLSIGIGWNLQDNGCPLDLAQYIASYFLKKFDAQLTKELDFYEKLDEVRKCVLLDCAFNMGVGGLETFKQTLNLVSQGFYQNAAVQMRKSKWYEEVPSRAEGLCQMMETGAWI